MAFDEDMKKALELAQSMKDAIGVQDLQPTTVTTQDVETGSPRTPGYEPDYGQTMKDAPQLPPDPEPSAPSPSAQTAPEPEPLADAVSPDSKVSEFDKWLEAAQGQEHKESHEQDRSNDLGH